MTILIMHYLNDAEASEKYLLNLFLKEGLNQFRRRNFVVDKQTKRKVNN